MGLLEKMLVDVGKKTVVALKKTAVNTSITGAILAADRHLDKTKSANAITEKSTTVYRLFIEKKFNIKRSFLIRDEYEDKIYQVKKDLFAKKEHLFDKEGKSIATVSKKKPLGAVSEYYVLTYGKKDLGKLRIIPALKRKYDIDFNGWRIEGNFWQWNFTVRDKEDTIVSMIHKAYESNDCYVIEYDSQANEIMAIMIMMAIDLDLQDS